MDNSFVQRAEHKLRFNHWKNTLPMILQAEVAECGLACLAMIACYHNFEIDLISLRRRHPVSNRGISLKDIIDIARNLNFSSRALKLELENIKVLQTPCILHWGFDHFVVLKSVSRRGIVVHDPAQGVRHVNWAIVDQEFTGVAVEFIPGENFSRGSETKTLKLGDFWTKISGLKRNLFHILSLSILLQAFSLLSPLYAQIVVDDVAFSGNSSLLIALALGFSLLLIIESVTGILRQLIIVRLSNQMNIQVATNLFKHLIYLGGDFFAKRQTGDIVSRFSSLKNVRDLVTTGLVSAILDGLMVSLTAVAMFVYNAKLALVSLMFVFLYGLFRWTFFPKYKLVTEESINVKAKETSHFLETIRCIESIKIFHGESIRTQQWQNLLVDTLNCDIKTSHWTIAFKSMNTFMFGVENIIIIYLAANSIMNSEMSVGMFFAFMTYKFRFSTSVDGFITNWISVKMISVHLARLADIVFAGEGGLSNSDRRVLASEFSVEELKSECIVEAKNLSYRFSDLDPMIFRNVSFQVKRGEIVAITGPSGCGKTTLLKALLGLITPTEGGVFIGGYPVSTSTENSTRVAAVMQNEHMFVGTILDNIVGFNEKVDFKKVELCAKRACIHEQVSTMVMGYKTRIGEGGIGLSGGQIQRLALARALYGDPEILFLDEASSHLDVVNESEINKNLRELKITCITVAHRAETIKFADRVIDLRDLSSGVNV